MVSNGNVEAYLLNGREGELSSDGTKMLYVADEVTDKAYQLFSNSVP